MSEAKNRDCLERLDSTRMRLASELRDIDKGRVPRYTEDGDFDHELWLQCELEETKLEMQNIKKAL